MKKTELTFKPLVFEGIRKFVTSPVAASVHKTAPNRVVLRISAEVAKKAGLKSGEPLTPFVDESNRALLLLEGVRPLPDTARKLWKTSGNAHTIDFPRRGALADLFPGQMLCTGLTLHECSQGRIVVLVPKL